MGIAGVAMFGAIFSFVMSIVSVVKYFQWKRSGVLATGVIGAQKGLPHQQKDYTEYIYDFTIHSKSKIIGKIYTERVRKGKSPRVKVGDIISVYWSSTDSSYAEVARLKKDLIQNPVACLICLLILALCYVLVTVLST